LSCPEPEGEEVEGFLDKLGDDRAEGGVAGGHEDWPPALVHQAVHRSVESLVYRQRKIQMESTTGLVWLRMVFIVVNQCCVSGSGVLMTKN
jgi:hypothetical protein